MVATAAAATPSGTVVFVVVTNDSSARGPVTITVAAASSNGRPTITGQSIIAALAADETEAAMVPLAIPASDTIGAVTSAVSGGATAGPPNPLKVTATAFVADAIEPAVTVTVSSTQPVAAEVVAVCYQGTALIGGGATTTATVRPGAPTTLRLAAALAQTPTSCTGFAYRA